MILRGHVDIMGDPASECRGLVKLRFRLMASVGLLLVFGLIGSSAQSVDPLELFIEDINLENRNRSVGLSFELPEPVESDEPEEASSELPFPHFGRPVRDDGLEPIAFRLDTSSNLTEWTWSGTIVTNEGAVSNDDGRVFVPISMAEPATGHFFRAHLIGVDQVAAAYLMEASAFRRLCGGNRPRPTYAFMGPEKFLSRDTDEPTRGLSLIELPPRSTFLYWERDWPLSKGGVASEDFLVAGNVHASWIHCWSNWKTDFWVLTIWKQSGNRRDRSRLVSGSRVESEIRYEHHSVFFELDLQGSGEDRILIDSEPFPFTGGGILLLDFGYSDASQGQLIKTYVNASRETDISDLSWEAPTAGHGYSPDGEDVAVDPERRACERVLKLREEFPEVASFFEGVEELPKNPPEE